MFPPLSARLARISECRFDLAQNGIDADALGGTALCALARRNLDSFQAMLGYDAGVREVVELIGRTRGSGAGARRPAARGTRRRSGLSRGRY